jgi:hypothetical protein
LIKPATPETKVSTGIKDKTWYKKLHATCCRGVFGHGEQGTDGEAILLG